MMCGGSIEIGMLETGVLVTVCVFPACDDIELHYFAFGHGVTVLWNQISFNEMF